MSRDLHRREDTQQRPTMDRTMLARATSSDDAPTPGYLFAEIAKITNANYEACQKLETYLLDRLKKNNHNVKFKTLQIIKVGAPPLISARGRCDVPRSDGARSVRRKFHTFAERRP